MNRDSVSATAVLSTRFGHAATAIAATSAGTSRPSSRRRVMAYTRATLATWQAMLRAATTPVSHAAGVSRKAPPSTKG
jgi:hypothetical protein